MDEQLVIEIVAEIGQMKAELEKAKKEIEGFSKSGKVKFGNFNTAMKTVGDTANKALAVTGAAITGAATALLSLSSSTEEYRTNQAKLNTAFETAGASAETATSTYNELYRVLGDDGQAVEAASHLALLTTNQKDLQEWTNICQGVYATFGDSLPIEGLTEAANETAKVGSVTGSLADALNWAGVSEDEFNAKLEACNSEAEREKLIRETLSGLYNEAATNYEKTAESTLEANEAQANLNATMAEIGETVAPIQSALTDMAASILKDLAPAVQSFMDEHGKGLKDLLLDIAEAIGKVIDFIVDNIEVIGTIAGIILAIVAAINLYNAAMAIYNIVMAPVNLTIIGIVAAIVALIAIITLCITYWDEICAAAQAAWDWIVDAWNNAGEWFNENVIQPIVQFFTGLWDGIVNLANSAWTGIQNIFNTVANWINNKVIKPVANFFSNLWSGFIDGAKKAWQGVKDVFSAVGGFFANCFNIVKEKILSVFAAGGKIFNGIKDGIVKVFTTVVNAIIKGINKVISLPFEGLNGILNTIHGLDIAGIKPFSWLTWRAPVPQIPLLAKGGIVDSATLAVIGERGKEAVLPLENNTEWIDILAAKINGNRSSKPLILQVDGKTFGEISIDCINNITEQTGTLALRLY